MDEILFHPEQATEGAHIGDEAMPSFNFHKAFNGLNTRSNLMFNNFEPKKPSISRFLKPISILLVSSRSESFRFSMINKWR
ncbi:hypothetical protein TorRG33x02_149560 [Trema orientale]|uniref:Uncharacterized protein n=1 Tax=Trema orientale TaxID=63057 RepID=A0A2P5EUT2_TREOI|nr:hypothetical protein TorRG33x02_149560 [Trema orientale]